MNTDTDTDTLEVPPFHDGGVVPEGRVFLGVDHGTRLPSKGVLVLVSTDGQRVTALCDLAQFNRELEKLEEGAARAVEQAAHEIRVKLAEIERDAQRRARTVTLRTGNSLGKSDQLAEVMKQLEQLPAEPLRVARHRPRFGPPPRREWWNR